MKSSISLFVHLSVWILLGSIAFGGDTTKPQAPSQKIAGEFYLGDGKGFNVSINLRQNGTFEYLAWGCIGDYAKGEGEFKAKDDLLILKYKPLLPKPEVPPKDGGYHAVGHVVAWSDRLYLIPKEDMIDFCNAINEGPNQDNTVGAFISCWRMTGKNRLQAALHYQRNG